MRFPLRLRVPPRLKKIIASWGAIPGWLLLAMDVLKWLWRRLSDMYDVLDTINLLKSLQISTIVDFVNRYSWAIGLAWLTAIAFWPTRRREIDGSSLPTAQPTRPNDPLALRDKQDETGGIISAPEPARLDLWIEKRGNRWIGKLRNKELRKVGPLALRIVDAQSFDMELNRYRESCGFHLRLASIPEIASGDYGKEFVFARVEGQHLEIGDTLGTRLPWPQADTNPIERWNLNLELEGFMPAYPLKTKWALALAIHWNTTNQELTFKMYTSGLVQD